MMVIHALNVSWFQSKLHSLLVLCHFVEICLFVAALFTCKVLVSIFIIFLISDINECETVPGMCEPNGVCVNTEGSAHCECESGFKFNEESRFCEGRKIFKGWHFLKNLNIRILPNLSELELVLMASFD